MASPIIFVLHHRPPPPAAPSLSSRRSIVASRAHVALPRRAANPCPVSLSSSSSSSPLRPLLRLRGKERGRAPLTCFYNAKQENLEPEPTEKVCFDRTFSLFLLSLILILRCDFVLRLELIYYGSKQGSDADCPVLRRWDVPWDWPTVSLTMLACAVRYLSIASALFTDQKKSCWNFYAQICYHCGTHCNLLADFFLFFFFVYTILFGRCFKLESG